MRVVPFLIDNLAALIAGGTEFSAMKSLVKDMQDSSFSGEEKRAKVIEDFCAIGYGIGGWVLNLLLELAVAWLKAK